jgi:ubiquinone/menaquinone biosynthesis C-methylase UbiE
MKEESSNAIHDRLASGYSEDPADALVRYKHQLLAPWIRPGSRLLDVGCATAQQLVMASPAAGLAVGLDLNRSMLDRARTNLRVSTTSSSVHLVQGSAAALPFPGGSFDLVWSFSTLLLVPSLDVALAEISRVLVPGGTAVLDITGRYNLGTLYWRRWYRSQQHDGLNAVGLGEGRRLLAAHGLDVLAATAAGAGDQIRYLPVAHRSAALRRFWSVGGDRSRDQVVSNLPLLDRLASRWFFVARRR